MVTTTSASTPSALDSHGSRLGALDWIALILLVIGGLNWGCIGIFGVDLVASIFGTMTMMSRIVYSLVGISAVYVAYLMTVLRR